MVAIERRGNVATAIRPLVVLHNLRASGFSNPISTSIPLWGFHTSFAPTGLAKAISARLLSHRFWLKKYQWLALDFTSRAYLALSNFQGWKVARCGRAKHSLHCNHCYLDMMICTKSSSYLALLTWRTLMLSRWAFHKSVPHLEYEGTSTIRTRVSCKVVILFRFLRS